MLGYAGAVGLGGRSLANDRGLPTGAIVSAADVVADVTTFGARGDGRTDDRSAIQAAIDTTRPSGGSVLFPPGTYLVGDSLIVDYGCRLVGSGAAATTLRMDPGVVRNLVVGGSSFPVRVELHDLTLDGGLGDRARDDIPPGDGVVSAAAGLAARGVVASLQLTGGTCPVGHGDVLRAPGQPAVVVNDAGTLAAGASGSVYVCEWAPDAALAAGHHWTVFRSGNLITGCGRLVVRGCLLVGAKRHAIQMDNATQGNLSGLEIGGQQGCALFARASSDFAVSDSWLYGCGGPHLYLRDSVDIRVHHCLLEGSAGASIYADWGELEVDHCGLWGGRTGLVVARRAGWVRLTGLKLREPGYGAGDATQLGSSGYSGLPGRPAIDVQHGDDDGAGLIATGCSLQSAVDGTGPMVRLVGGSRSNLSALEWSPDVSFAAGERPSSIVLDAGRGTIVRGVRGVPDQP